MLLLLFSYKALLMLGAAGVGGAIWVHRRRMKRSETSLRGDLERLAHAAPGGTPEQPLVVPSAAVIESPATSLPCHACGDLELEVELHRAEIIDDVHLRVLQVACRDCGAKREVFVHLQDQA